MMNSDERRVARRKQARFPEQSQPAAAVAPEPVPPAAAAEPPADPIAEANAVRASFPPAQQPDPVAIRRRWLLKEMLDGRALEELTDEGCADVAQRLGLLANEQQSDQGNVPAVALRAALRHVLNGTTPGADDTTS